MAVRTLGMTCPRTWEIELWFHDDGASGGLEIGEALQKELSEAALAVFRQSGARRHSA